MIRTRGYASTGSSGGSAASTPTGTGVRKVVGGVEDAAASTIVNADVNAAAAIAGTKVAPDFGAQNIVTTGYCSIGATPATTGSMRIAAGHIWSGRNVANSANLKLMELGASDVLYFGSTDIANNVVNSSGGGIIYLRVGATDVLQARPSEARFSQIVTCAQPITGSSSAYGVHGMGTQAMADANQTPSSAVYQYGTVQTTGALTVARDLTFPNATDAAAYTKWIVNACTGGFGVVVKTAGVGTVTVAMGKAAAVLMNAGGVTRLTADV